MQAKLTLAQFSSIVSRHQELSKIGQLKDRKNTQVINELNWTDLIGSGVLVPWNLKALLLLLLLPLVMLRLPILVIVPLLLLLLLVITLLLLLLLLGLLIITVIAIGKNTKQTDEICKLFIDPWLAQRTNYIVISTKINRDIHTPTKQRNLTFEGFKCLRKIVVQNDTQLYLNPQMQFWNISWKFPVCLSSGNKMSMF